MIFREPFPSCAYTRIFRIHACCIARHTRARVNGKKKNQKNTPDETLEARLREFANLRFRKTFYANTALDGVMFENENATTRIRIIRSRDRLQTYPTGRVSFASPKSRSRRYVRPHKSHPTRFVRRVRGCSRANRVPAERRKPLLQTNTFRSRPIQETGATTRRSTSATYTRPVDGCVERPRGSRTPCRSGREIRPAICVRVFRPTIASGSFATFRS